MSAAPAPSTPSTPSAHRASVPPAPASPPAVPSAVATSEGSRAWLALAVLMLPVLLVSIDNTVLSFALPAISVDLVTSGTTLLWIVDAYPLVLAGLLVTMGSLGDRVGRRRLLMTGAVGFAALSVVAALAPTAEVLVGARAGLGLFGAMLMPSTLSLLRSIFPDRARRRLAVAIWAAGFAAGAALGPVVGGILLAHFAWGSVFLLAVPVLVVMLALTPALVPESRDPEPGPIDPVSILLSMVTMVPVVYAIKNVAANGSVVVTVVGVVVGLTAGVLFVRRQQSREHPMLDVTLFARAPFTGAVLVNLLAMFSLTGFLYFGSQHLQLVLGLEPLTAGLALVPGLGVMVLAGLAVVPLVRRVHPRLVVAGALTSSAVAYAVFAAIGDGISAGALALVFALLGAGVGASETVSNDLVVSAAPPHRAGAAAAISETAYEVGALFGTAVLGSILVSSYRDGVQLPAGLSAEQREAATETLGGAVSVAEQLPAGAAEALRASATHAFDSGVVTTSLIGAVLMVGAAALGWRLLRHAD